MTSTYDKEAWEDGLKQLADEGQKCDQLDALRELLEADERGAIDALEHGQQQADMDGIMVTVSRQALDMVVSACRAALTAEKEGE